MIPQTDVHEIVKVVKRYWGYDQLRPLQAEAIRAGLDQRDSLVVLPTGGGKSLCYQVPPLVKDRTDFVVSPLISLMKDQVDGLLSNGYPAASIHSALSAEQRRAQEDLISSGKSRLVFISPERLFTPWFNHISQRLDIGSFAIDEAHCISHWGHDFRKEYRRLSVLKQRFPNAGVHAFTATATERVRHDIIHQLQLVDPEVLVGRFDRPNLVYRIQARQQLREQVLEVLSRHRNEAVIIYAISRDETERLAGFLKERGHRAGYYHAGMKAQERREAQEAFTKEDLDIIVATVAFGMGIDRSDVRCVMHAGMPQSVEHYQQETGRAGRDGLEAECILFYSPADVLRWQSLFEKNTQSTPAAQQGHQTALHLLNEMKRFSAPGRCRHQMLSEYFGQQYDSLPCNACDVCLGEVDDLVDGTVQAQMILSCVRRLRERFGAGYVVDILRGSETARIKASDHAQLSTYGLMADVPKNSVMNMVFQLLDQKILARTKHEFPTLKLNETSWEVLKGNKQVWLLPTKTRKVKKTRVEVASWEDVDRGLFDRLRALRTSTAREKGVPPYVIFNDATLRDMARRKPTTGFELLQVHGVGEKKLSDYGKRFLACIAEAESNPEGQH